MCGVVVLIVVGILVETSRERDRGTFGHNGRVVVGWQSEVPVYLPAISHVQKRRPAHQIGQVVIVSLFYSLSKFMQPVNGGDCAKMVRSKFFKWFGGHLMTIRYRQDGNEVLVPVCIGGEYCGEFRQGAFELPYDKSMNDACQCRAGAIARQLVQHDDVVAECEVEL